MTAYNPVSSGLIALVAYKGGIDPFTTQDLISGTRSFNRSAGRIWSFPLR